MLLNLNTFVLYRSCNIFLHLLIFKLIYTNVFCLLVFLFSLRACARVYIYIYIYMYIYIYVCVCVCVRECVVMHIFK